MVGAFARKTAEPPREAAGTSYLAWSRAGALCSRIRAVPVFGLLHCGSGRTHWCHSPKNKARAGTTLIASIRGPGRSRTPAELMNCSRDARRKEQMRRRAESPGSTRTNQQCRGCRPAAFCESDSGCRLPCIQARSHQGATSWTSRTRAAEAMKSRPVTPHAKRELEIFAWRIPRTPR